MDKTTMPDAVWTKSENPELRDNKDHILRLMEELNIVARPRSLSEKGDEDKEENYWIAPCMLRQETPRRFITPESNDEMESTSVLSYRFKEQYLPHPIFHRLVAACVACWPIAKQNLENLIFCGCCIFDLGNSHKLYLHFREYIIFARITRMGIKERTPDAKVCSKVRKLITDKIYEILDCLCQRLDFELCIQCPRSDGDSLHQVVSLSELQKNAELTCDSHENSHVITSSDLLRFWFEDEKTQQREDKSDSLRQLKGTLYRNVLNQCLPTLVRDLYFDTVSMYIQQKELFDDVTMRDILEQKTTTDKIKELIKQIQQRGPDTYEKFKECLVLARQPDLKDLLEKEEAKCGIDLKDKHDDQSTDSLNSYDETHLKELYTDTAHPDAETHLKEFDTGSINQDEETTPKVFDTGSTVMMDSFDDTISAEISMPERLGPEGASNPSSLQLAVSRCEEESD